MGEESIEHIFKECNWAIFFWQASPLRLSFSRGVDRLSLHKWIGSVIHNKSTEFVEIFASLLWSIWKSKNIREFQNNQLTHLECFHLAQIMRNDYQIANSKAPSAAASPVPLPRWIPPVGRIKFNSDASVGANGDAGFGGAFRDHDGMLIKALAHFRPNCKDIDLAEGVACLHGILIARESGFQDIIVEYDNQNLIFALQRGLVPRTTVIGDILQLGKCFDKIIFLWIGRHQNRLAHHLASLARTGVSFDDNNPSLNSILCIVSSDISNLNE